MRAGWGTPSGSLLGSPRVQRLVTSIPDSPGRMLVHLQEWQGEREEKVAVLLEAHSCHKSIPKSKETGKPIGNQKIELSPQRVPILRTLEVKNSLKSLEE